MKLALHVLAYDVNRYINSMLRNAAPHVDKIYIAYPRRPWDYIPQSRENRSNPTRIADICYQGLECKVEIIEGDWEKEHDTRNACLARARADGFDWLITQDADEFYTEDSWRQIKAQMLLHPEIELFKTTWFNFWKSSEFIIADPAGSVKDTNAGFALRCTDSLRFDSARKSNAQKICVLDCPCYHYGYVKSDQEMFEKVTQWGHAHQVNGVRWYEIKWLNWNLDTVNLGMVTGPRGMAWKRAVRFPLHQPDFAMEFAYNIDFERRPPLKASLRNLCYDAQMDSRLALRRIKRLLKGDSK